jgi:methionyl-tRNA synthetase
MSQKFYITTTLPYVNADPHIGFALEIIEADAIARYHKLIGDDVIFNFGTDEHGQKIYQKALEAGKDPQKYADEYAAKFDDLKNSLNLSYTNFIRTTDKSHEKAAQEFWNLCLKSGDIYKKLYKTKYCVGCELEKTDSELINGHCPIHPNLEIEIIEEENYFFKFSNYQESLLNFYKKNPNFIVPESKFNEIKAFVENGLQDFSISRLKSKMPWGIDVPNDKDHVMYVWFDALVNYISTLGWPNDKENFDNFWPGIQVAGKDNLRQQTAIWQAMLMSAGLPNSKQIFIHGFITVDGQKISKSLGNVVNPLDLVKKYDTDPVRYFLLGKVSPFEDGDFSYEKFEESYNSDLANGLGNLISRVAALAEKSGFEFPVNKTKSFDIEMKIPLEKYEFNNALKTIWDKIKELDQLINHKEVWKLTGDELQKALEFLVNDIRQIAYDLKPFLPETAEKISKQFNLPIIKSGSPLFPRLK